MQQQAQPFVYVAYSRFNAEAMRSIADILRQEGVTLWVDSEQLNTGDDWQAKLDEIYINCAAVVLIFSDESPNSEYFNRTEIPRILELKKRIFPIRLNRSQPPPGLEHINYTDLADSSLDFEKRIRELAKVLNEFLATSTADAGAVQQSAANVEDSALLDDANIAASASLPADNANNIVKPPRKQSANKAPPTSKRPSAKQQVRPVQQRGSKSATSIDTTGTDAPISQASTPPTPPPSPSTTERQIAYRIAEQALSDQPIEKIADDRLGFAAYARALARFILSDSTKKPLTIAIDAPWGMGKTSLMNMINDELISNKENKEKIYTIQFNAWRYDKEDALWASLALTIIREVAKQQPKLNQWAFDFKLNSRRFDGSQFIKDVRDGLINNLLAIVVVYLVMVILLLVMGDALVSALQQGLLSIVVSGGIIGAITYGKQLRASLADFFNLKIDRYMRRPNYRERIGFLADFEDDLRTVVDVATDNGKRTLVIFIDDLDRCSVGRAVEVMEAINLFLDQKHCVFVIGMDSRTVAASIEARYEKLKTLLDADTPQGLAFGRRFLEKIIQINFRIPPANDSTFFSLIETSLNFNQAATEAKPTASVQQRATSALRDQVADANTSIASAAQQVAARDPSLPQAALQEAAQQILEEQFDNLTEVKEAVAGVVKYLGYNPRRVKRFINLFRLQAYIANSGSKSLLTQGSIKLDMLATWLLVAMLWPDFIEKINADKDFDDRLLQANYFKRNLEAGHPFKPYDLRDQDVEANADPKESQAKLTQMQADPVLAQLIGENELIHLIDDRLKSLDESQIEMYLRLVGTVREATVAETTANPPTTNADPQPTKK